MPKKKGDFGRPVIPIKIGPHEFNQVICNLGASFNVMPKVIYDHILQFDTLLYTTMHMQLVDQSTRRVEGIAEYICIQVGSSYVSVDFVVLDTGCDLKAPIILGRPFQHTTKAIIQAESARICF